VPSSVSASIYTSPSALTLSSAESARRKSIHSTRCRQMLIMAAAPLSTIVMFHQPRSVFDGCVLSGSNIAFSIYRRRKAAKDRHSGASRRSPRRSSYGSSASAGWSLNGGASSMSGDVSHAFCSSGVAISSSLGRFGCFAMCNPQTPYSDHHPRTSLRGAERRNNPASQQPPYDPLDCFPGVRQ